MTKAKTLSLPDMPEIRLTVGGRERRFDIDDPELPGWVANKAMLSGGLYF